MLPNSCSFQLCFFFLLFNGILVFLGLAIIWFYISNGEDRSDLVRVGREQPKNMTGGGGDLSSVLMVSVKVSTARVEKQGDVQ